MLFEKRIIRHWGMASPAEIGYVGLESNVLSPIHGRVRFFYMTEEAYRLAVYLSNLAIIIKHNVRID